MSILDLDLNALLTILVIINAGFMLFSFWGIGRYQRRSEVVKCQLLITELEERLKVAQRENANLRMERSKLLNKLIESRTVPPWADHAFGPVQPHEE